MAIKINGTNTTASPGITGPDTDTGLVYGTDEVQVVTGGSTRATVDSSGNVGLGTSSFTATSSGRQILELNGTSSSLINLDVGGTRKAYHFTDGTSVYSYNTANGNYIFGTNDTERMRIDSSGNVMIGTTSAASYSQLTVRATSPQLSLYATPGQVSCLNMGDTDDNDIGQVCYSNSDNSMRFVTNAGERMRIDSSGNFMVGKTASGGDNNGAELRGGSSNYAGLFTAHNHTPLFVNRKTNDGDLVIFRQDNNNEGSISVSGSTVSYNGAHLSRWSQLANGAARTEILRGSVLSNLDEMCEWGEENNEQLNRMQVSSVEGDRNVAGVFQAWDDDDDTYVNDFYCAMTGDFVIRIAQGTTVARGDLLMSAGDGTAKPQDDDIVRSKTIAKVTSTTVSTTYSDNSYCVPCVLMAC